MVGVVQEGQEGYASRVRGEVEGLANVTYRAYVPPEEIMETFSQAKALVNTSSEEGFPNTFLEAWLAGRPVVSFHVNPDGVLDDPLMGTVADDPAGIMGYVAGAGGDGVARLRRERVRRDHDPDVELGRLMDRIRRL